MNADQYFGELQELLQQEREADRELYHRQMMQTPLKERQEKGLTWYPVQIKAAEIGAGEQYYLSLEKTKNLGTGAFQVGQPVVVFLNTNKQGDKYRLRGVIAALWHDMMRVATSVDELPDWLDESPLGVDLLFDDNSYQEMQQALRNARSIKGDRFAELRDVLINQQEAIFQELKPHQGQNAQLNISQQAAVQKVLSARDVALVHGPPGTGKTTTLVAAIKQTLEQEKQVLVCAPSNTAVDLLTQRLAEKGLSVLRVGHPARLDPEVLDHSLDAMVAQHEDYRFLKKLRQQSEEMRRMAGKYKRKFGKAEAEQRRLLYAEASQLRGQAQALEKYIVEQLVNGAQVITATLVGSVNKYIQSKRFSTVFIDEAAQALEPACWIPISKADRVIMAGDHCQLPPTVKSEEAARAGLSQTLFEKLMQKYGLGQMLQVQYRMPQPIMQFSNEMFYQNELKAHESVANRRLSEQKDLVELYRQMSFIDTAGCSFEEVKEAESQSRYNPEEARLLIKHLKNLLETLEQKATARISPDFSIGIISPYKAQVRFMKQLIEEDAYFEVFQPYLKVSSIDGFQGQECDVIYLSLVRSNEQGQIGFLQDTRRLNVALTRAKSRLVVFGDSATIGGHAFYQAFLEYAERNNLYQTAWEYLA